VELAIKNRTGGELKQLQTPLLKDDIEYELVSVLFRFPVFLQQLLYFLAGLWLSASSQPSASPILSIGLAHPLRKRDELVLLLPTAKRFD
jgi:hypothetical protein